MLYLQHRNLWLLATLLAGGLSAMLCQAQITLDGTLGPRGPLKGPNYEVRATDGQQHGGNLFHSFGQFNIHQGESATFTGPNSVQSILSRVTGGSRSTIDGLLRSVIPDANLFLINPAGVVFGPNARLDVSGSFHVSTADYLRLGDEGRFDASHPANSVLNTAPVVAFGFLGPGPGPITMESTTLEVPEEQAVSVVGGEVAIKGGGSSVQRGITAPNGRINLVSVASQGEVALRDTNIETGSFERLGNITLSGSGVVSTSGEGGGAIYIRGGRLVVEDGSRVLSSSFGAGDAGDINITTERLVLRNNASISADSLGPGDGGNLTVSTDSLKLLGEQGFAYISSTTEGAGDAGDLKVTAKHVLLRGGKAFTGLSTQVVGEPQVLGEGKAGELRLTTDRLEVLNGANISSTAINSAKDAGDIVVTADTIFISGNVLQGGTGRSGIFAEVRGVEPTGSGGDIRIITQDLLQLAEGGIITARSFGPGKGGSINVYTNRLDISDGAALVTTNFAEGKAGDIAVTANTAFIAGLDSQGTRAGIYAAATRDSTGSGGDIRITVQDLQLTDRGVITAQSSGLGDSGRIDVHTSRLDISDGAFLSTTNFGQGKAGGLNVSAENVRLAGPSPEGLNTGIFAVADVMARGAGDIRLTANSLQVLDGAEISSRTSGPGMGGTIDISVSNALVAGEDTLNNLKARIDARTFIFRGLAANATGRGGNVRIQSQELALRDGGEITALSSSAGDGGDVELIADRLTLTDGAVVSVESSGGGDSGDIEVQTASLDISAGAFLSSSNVGIGGQAGDITIGAKQVRLAGPSPEGLVTGIFSQSGARALGSGAIRLNADSLQVLEGAEINSRTSGPGAGGIIDITATNVLIAGEDVVNSVRSRVDARTFLSGDFIANATGRGGNVRIQSQELALRDGGEITALSSSAGDGGDVELIADRLTLTDGAVVSVESSGGGDSGDIEIQTASLDISAGAFLSSSNVGIGGQAGDITIGAKQVRLTGPSPEGLVTGIFSQSGVRALGSGAIRLNADSLQVLEGAEINSRTSGPGAGGIIDITAANVLIAGRDAVNNVGSRIDARTFSTVDVVTQATGRGGNVQIQSLNLELRNGGEITALSSSAGDGGDIGLITNRLTLADGASVSVASTGGGDAGNILIRVAGTFQSENSSVTAQAEQAGGGSIELHNQNLVTLTNSAVTTSVARGGADAGNITISKPATLILNSSRVQANAFEGRGGNVRIAADVLVLSTDSVIEASSERGIQGVVEINSPNTDISGNLVTLPAAFVDVAALLSDRCGARKAEETSSFVVVGRGGLPLDPDALLPSRYGDDEITAKTSVHPASDKSASMPKVFPTTPKLALLNSECIQ